MATFLPARTLPALERTSSNESSAGSTKNLSWSNEVTYLDGASPVFQIQRRITGTEGRFRCKTCSVVFDSRQCCEKHENYCVHVPASSPRSDSGFDSSEADFRPSSTEPITVPDRLSMIGLTQIKIPLNL